MLIPPPDRLGKTTDPGDGYAASAQSMGAALNATVRHRHLCCPQSPSIRKVTSWAKLEIGISKTASAACRRYSVHCPDQEPIRHRRTRRFRVAQTLQVERVPLQPAVLCHWPRLWASGDARPTAGSESSTECRPHRTVPRAQHYRLFFLPVARECGRVCFKAEAP